MTSATLDSYDAVPYPGDPVAAMHPDHLAALGRLFGLATASPDRCRVLELGCCDGGNLIPLAMNYPGSTFLGVDLSREQIAAGVAELPSLGVTNLDLRHASILDVTPDWGTFDYILCHGVYSWVPPHVQAHLLQVMRQNLAPGGIAFISYNTYPGWHTAGVVRAALLFAARNETTWPARLERARATLTFLEKGLAGDNSPYAQGVRGLIAELRDRPDYYLAHELLEEHNEPLWFDEFIRRTQGAGLRFLSESNLAVAEPALFAPEAQQALGKFADSRLAREQGLDLLRNRRFRQSLLVQREVVARDSPDANALAGLWVSSEARSVESERPGTSTFALLDGSSLTTTDDGLIATFHALEATWPGAIPVRDLRASPSQLLGCLTRGLLAVHAVPPTAVRDPGNYPESCRWACRQAERGARVTDLRHRLTELDSTERLLLARLDGQTDRAGLVRWLEERVQRGKIVFTAGAMPEGEALRAALGEILDVVLRNLTRQALLRASSSPPR
jgi:SAM-dependent methyltransferase